MATAGVGGGDVPADGQRSPGSVVLHGATRLGSWSVRRAVDLSEVRHETEQAVVRQARSDDAADGPGPDGDATADAGSRVSLVVSELATNALKYGSGVATVTVSGVTDGWLVDVHDANLREYPRAQRADPRRLSQHGLTVVTSLCPDWGWYVDSWTLRKHVWAVVTRSHVTV